MPGAKKAIFGWASARHRRSAAAALVFSLLLVPIGYAASSAGSLDPSFSGDGRQTASVGDSNRAYGLALQRDDKIVMAGYFFDLNNPDLPRGIALVRYTAGGELDRSFSDDGKVATPPPGGGIPQSGGDVAVQPDGKIVVAGTLLPHRGQSMFLVARYTPSGMLDSTFSDDGYATVSFDGGGAAGGIVLQPDGKIVVAGADREEGGDFALARLDLKGELDRSFSDDGQAVTSLSGKDSGGDVALQRNGKIVVVGSADADLALARYNIDGSLDNAFSGDGKQVTDLGGAEGGTGVAVRPDGRIVAGATSRPADGRGPDFALASFRSDGRRDRTFSEDGMLTTDFGGYDGAGALSLQADNKVVLAGTSDGDFALGRYTADGRLDPSFATDGRQTTDFGTYADQGADVAIQADRRIVVGGTSGADPTDFALARYLPGGRGSVGGGGEGRPPGRTVVGTGGADVLVGTPGNDRILCGAGADRVSGRGGDDRIDCGSGGDFVAAGSGNDSVRGGSGADVIDGGRGSDHLAGEGGDDRLRGGPGNDRVSGGSGTDSVVR